MVNTKHKNERIHINAIEINAFLASSYSFKYYFTNWKINFIPFIRLFFEAFYIIIYDAVAISAMFLNLYNSNDYTNKLKEYDKNHII